jgi:KTSC domain
VSWNQSVYSSNAESVGYDSNTGEMTVTWKSGKVSAYAGVPEEVALQVANSPSVGSTINSEIKGSYEHRYR